MNYFVEIRNSIKRVGPPKLVPLADVYNYRGFRSVFAFDEATAELIQETGSTAGLRGVAVYANEILMDFDSHQPLKFRAWLQGSGLEYEEFDSGNRSVHFHIPLAAVFGSWVPGAIKAWVQQHAPKADISFLHPSGVYRLPGTYHAKAPGRRKELVDYRFGAALSITEPTTTTQRLIIREDSSRETFLSRLMTAASEGGRRPWIWHTATIGAEAGIPHDEVLGALLRWNARLCFPPHMPMVIEEQVANAFKRLSRSA